MEYIVQSPVLLLGFNRPDMTLQVFNAIKLVKPKRLYFAVDGPRQHNETDVDLCGKVRAIAGLIDWECSLFTYFGERNKGCRIGVSSAIDWFFEKEEEGIILEDDCVPVSSFFYFCDRMLEHYRFDTRIHNITGTNLQLGKRWGNASYYFSEYSNIWGWASWRRVWQKYDVTLSKYTEAEAAAQLIKVFNDPFLVNDWMVIFNDLKAGKIDTWDYQFNFITYFENCLCVTPNVNLIKNIGFRADATHTDDPENHHANLPTEELADQIIHPHYFRPDREADYFFLKKEFGLDQRWKRYNKKTKRFKRWFRSMVGIKEKSLLNAPSE